MKKSILSIAIITTTLLTSCNNSTEKVENAQAAVVEANENLDEANQEYLADIETYRTETSEKIAANEKSIADFKLRVENEKKEAKSEYKKKIAELEQKNSDMKKTMDDYKAEGKDKWESFKTEFSHDMDELGKAFSDLGTNNIK